MPFDPISYALAKRVSRIAATKPVKRSDLEYPTADVELGYLLAIGKMRLDSINGNIYAGMVTVDSFADKQLENWMNDVSGGRLFVARWQDPNNEYYNTLYSGLSTEDHKLYVVSGGPATVLASEAVDIAQYAWYYMKLKVAGSTISSERAGNVISATDTTFASGLFGYALYGNQDMEYDKGRLASKLMNASSPLPKALAIIEAEVVGSGKEDDPYRPALARQLDEHPQYGKIDKLAVSWGAFDYKREATMLIMITGDNPYQAGAIDKQKEHASKKGLKVLSPPRDYFEAIEQYRKLKSDYPHWLAGKDNYAYQALGHEALELFQVADFYYGELIEHKTHYQQLKDVPSWEMNRTLNRWRDRLQRVDVLHEERDKHLKKLTEVLKKGW